MIDIHLLNGRVSILVFPESLIQRHIFNCNHHPNAEMVTLKTARTDDV